MSSSASWTAERSAISSFTSRKSMSSGRRWMADKTWCLMLMREDYGAVRARQVQTISPLRLTVQIGIHSVQKCFQVEFHSLSSIQFYESLLNFLHQFGVTGKLLVRVGECDCDCCHYSKAQWARCSSALYRPCSSRSASRCGRPASMIFRCVVSRSYGTRCSTTSCSAGW